MVALGTMMALGALYAYRMGAMAGALVLTVGSVLVLLVSVSARDLLREDADA